MTEIIIRMDNNNDLAHLHQYVDKMKADYTFLRLSEAIELSRCALEKSRRDEYIGQLCDILDADAIGDIVCIFRAVSNGYENTLYDALVKYLKEGKKPKFDSRLLDRLFKKGVKRAEA